MGRYNSPNPISLSDSGPPPNANFHPTGKHQSLQGSGSPQNRVLGYAGDEYLDLDTGDKWNKMGPTDEPRRATVDEWEFVGSVKNVISFGADKTGVEDSTAAFDLAKAAIEAAGSGALFVPDGTYVTTGLVFDQRVSLIGESRRGVIFKPYGAGVTVLTLTGVAAEGDAEQATYEKFTINCLDDDSVPITGTIGIVVGGSLPLDSGRNRFSDIYVNGAGSHGIVLASSTANFFTNIYVENCLGNGWFIDNEANVQANIFIHCISRQNSVGYYAGSGNNMAFIGCVFESNKNQGMYLTRRVTSGFAHCTFDDCWFEANNNAPTVPATERGAIYFDGIATFDDVPLIDQTTLPMNLIFRCCNITSSDGHYDVVADRAQGVEFEKCKFSRSTGTYTSDKFRFNGGNKAVQIFLKQCGTLYDVPTPTMYASFPALHADGDELYGFFYEFIWKGRRYTNHFPDSGQWTPSLANVTNMGGLTAAVCNYSRNGNVVTCSGRVIVDPIAAAVSAFTMTLPPLFTSAFVTDGNLAGVAFCPAIAGFGAAILADVTGPRAKFQWIAVDITEQDLFFTFSYVIL